MNLEDIHFFSAELKNGHVMSTPKYQPEGEFVGSLIHEIESKKPEFAWFQLVFQSADYHRDLLTVKAGLSSYVRMADTPVPKEDWDGKQYEVERREKGTEWYRSAQAKVKKVDQIKSLPTLRLALRGMWVGDLDDLTSMVAIQNCSDEIDSLVIAPLHDPRMLLWLQQRRMVDPGQYLRDYGLKARRAAPSLVLTTEEVPYYVNLPAGKIAESIRSIEFDKAQTAETEDDAEVDALDGIVTYGLESMVGEDTPGPVSVMAQELPVLPKQLTEEELSRLRLLPVASRRSFEIVYDPSWDLGAEQKGAEKRPTRVVLWAESSKDLRSYRRLLFSVYGRVDFAPADLLPHYVASVVPAAVRDLISAQMPKPTSAQQPLAKEVN